MRIALGIVVPVAAALLQAVVGGSIGVAGAYPNLPALAAGSWAVATGAREALWWGFVGGLAFDLLSGGPLGAFTVALLPAVLLAGMGERSSAQPIPVIAGAVSVGVGALIAQALYLAILSFLGRSVGPAPAVVAGTVGVALYTGALALVVYPLARMGRRLTEKESPF